MRLLSFALVLLWHVQFTVNQPAIAAPDGFTELQIGDKAPDFDLPGVDGKRYSLKDFADAKLLLVVFTCNHCPTAQAYESRIMQLHADYKDKGVALVAISPNDDQALRLDELGYTDVGDSFDDMKVRANERGFTFPYLYDGETQKTVPRIRRDGDAAGLLVRWRSKAALCRPHRRLRRENGDQSRRAERC